MKILIATIIGFMFCVAAVAAPVTIYKFESKEKEKIFYKLSDEIRCLVCQNQNIAESNSELAQDLKMQIYNMLQQDKSEDEITTFMVERDGDYVLFNPPFKPLTWMLWLGPLLIFILGMAYAITMIKSKRRVDKDNDELSVDDISRLNNLKSELPASKTEGKRK